MEEIDLVAFLAVENSEDDDEEIVQVKKPKTNNTVDNLINKVAKQQIQDNISYKGAANIAQLMNQMPNAAIELHLNKHSLKNSAYKQLEHRILIECEKCDDLVLEKTNCNGCKRLMLKN